MRDLEAGIATVALIWLVSKVAVWFETREKQHKEILARIRDINTRVEALYKWGSIVADSEVDEDSPLDDELDADTKAEIAEYIKDGEEGRSLAQHNLGVTYWNIAIPHYNEHNAIGYRKAVPWLRKAAKCGYECESTLGDAYRGLKDYDKAVYWYLKSVKRDGILVWIPESNIGEMYSEGQGVMQNHAEAARWWQKSADHGGEWARYRLGELYAEGAEGVEKDNEKAYFHLYIASSFTGEHSPRESATRRLEEVEKSLGEYSKLQQKKRAQEWFAAYNALVDKKYNAWIGEKAKSKVKPLPLPQ